MKICLLGLDGVTMERLEDERLLNLRRLMEVGLYGALENNMPMAPVSAWTGMATSQPLSAIADAGAGAGEELTIWSHLGAAGKKSILVGVPPSYPPRRVNGVCVGGVLAPDNSDSVTPRDFAVPAEIQSELRELLGEYPVDGKRLAIAHSSTGADALRNEIIRVSDKQWRAGRWLLSKHVWDYFHYVDSGLETVLRLGPIGEQTVEQNDSGRLWADYCVALDEQVGAVLELLDDQTIVLLLSTRNGIAKDAGHPCKSGAFILAAPNCPLTGEFHGARLIDMAPTLLDLAGYEIPGSMQGRSLVAGLPKKDGGSSAASDEKLLMDRLSGLGYV